MVITTSLVRTASPVRIFGVAAVMSMPTSAIACTATGLTWSFGAVPAERTSIVSPARAVSQPAAIWDRPALCTQTNSTDGLPAGDFTVTRNSFDPRGEDQGWASTTSSAARPASGYNASTSAAPAAAPTSCAARKAGTEAGAIPANVSEKIRPMLTAGLANDVEEVNQYADPM